jgi:HlyD family secretion protein
MNEICTSLIHRTFQMEKIWRRVMTLKRISGLIVLLVIIGFIASGCTQSEAPADLENEALGLTEFSNIASASGKVVPVQWATLGLESGGRIIWLVDEGTEVEAGDELAQLDTADLEAAMSQAKAAHASALAQLEETRVGATSQEIAAAEAAVLAARGNVAVAEARLSQAEANVSLSEKRAEANLAQAEGAEEAAKADLARANAELTRLRAGARPEEIAMYEALVVQAEAQYLQPRTTHDDIINREIGGVPEELARFQMQAAEAARNAAQAELALARAGASAEEISVAVATVRAAQAQVTIAEAGVTAAQAELAEAQASQNEVAEARAQLQIAEGQLAQAEAERDKLIVGASDEEIAMLEAQVDQAAAALEEAELALAKATLVAPFAGTVGVSHARVGEIIAPSTFAPVPVMTLGDTSTIRVETTDLNEVDAAQVTIGSPVTLTFDALPDKAIEGTIAYLAPMASEGQGGTNFKAIINMEDPPEALKWGMTAFVDVEID